MRKRLALIPLAGALIIIAMAAAGCICGNTGPAPSPAATPTPVTTPTGMPAGTATPVATATPTPAPVLSAALSDWGTDKGTYARGENATGWVYVRNTGDHAIDRMDFTLVIHRSVPIIGDYSIAYNYNMTGLDIEPGETEKVQFTQPIPAEYSGISTAGNYRFDVTAFLSGKVAGTFSRDIKVV